MYGCMYKGRSSNIQTFLFFFFFFFFAYVGMRTRHLLFLSSNFVFLNSSSSVHSNFSQHVKCMYVYRYVCMYVCMYEGRSRYSDFLCIFSKKVKYFSNILFESVPVSILFMNRLSQSVCYFLFLICFEF